MDGFELLDSISAEPVDQVRVRWLDIAIGQNRALISHFNIAFDFPPTSLHLSLDLPHRHED